jgi:hypothetical protein
VKLFQFCFCLNDRFQKATMFFLHELNKVSSGDTFF